MVQLTSSGSYGRLHAIYSRIMGYSGTGNLSVTTADVTADRRAIFAMNQGNGDVTVTSTGTLTGSGDSTVTARVFGGGDVTVNVRDGRGDRERVRQRASGNRHAFIRVGRRPLRFDRHPCDRYR